MKRINITTWQSLPQETPDFNCFSIVYPLNDGRTLDQSSNDVPSGFIVHYVENILFLSAGKISLSLRLTPFILISTLKYSLEKLKSPEHNGDENEKTKKNEAKMFFR